MTENLLTIRPGPQYKQVAISEFGGSAGTRVQVAEKGGATKNRLVSSASIKEGFAVYSPNSSLKQIQPGNEFVGRFSSRTNETTTVFGYGGPGDQFIFEGKNIQGTIHSSAPENGRPTVVKIDLIDSHLALFGASIVLTDLKNRIIHARRGMSQSKLVKFDKKGKASFEELGGFEEFGAVEAI